MGDQGGGHMEGGHVSHARNESQNESAPAKRLVDKRNSTATESDELPSKFPRTETDTRQAPTPTPRPVSEPISCAVRTKPVEPPVTKATLSELDVGKIIHNPKLRHDINFDPDLHFRPNLDGEKGRRKQEKANQFWNTLRNQLIQFVADREGFQHDHPSDDDWCLPALLKAVKEIITTLVPTRDRQFLNEGLNVELLMQQFNRGIADLEKLASWLSSVLKLHCAPMRDEWVDEMYQELSNGNRDNDVAELVKGMRSLLSVLEAMKLDVANHQIRCLRPALIEDTVSFEQRFFWKKISAGRLDVGAARSWYEEAVRNCSGASQSTQPFGETAAFFENLVRLILPSTDKESIPNTFLFDEERLVKLRSDMLDTVNLEVCMRLYEDLDRVSRANEIRLLTPAPTPDPAYVVDDDAASSHGSSGDFSLVNTPPSPPHSLALSACSSASSSPRSSDYVTVQPPADVADAQSKANTVYDSLLALLHTASPGSRPVQRWRSLVPAIAIQIFRYINAPQGMLPVFECKLAQHLCEMDSVYLEVEQHFYNKILAELGQRVKEFKDLSGVALFSVATGGRLQCPWRDGTRDNSHNCDSMDTSFSEGRDEGGVEDMATRLAHLGVLHWRVWAQMAYLGDVDELARDSARDSAPLCRP